MQIRSGRYADRVTHEEHREARPAVVEPWPDHIPDAVRDAFPETNGVLWGHQAEALHHLEAGRHVALATGTSSGKSLVFQAAGLTAIRAGRAGNALVGNRRPTVLYIAPTKALAADQWRRLAPLDVRAATVDGDNSQEERAWARDHAAWVLTNPDTLHHVLLPSHQRWTRLFGGLRYVVVDEAHHYRGVFGAHVAHVLRRLRRVCASYGASPQFVLASATMADPAEVAGRLTGLEVVAIDDDASPRPARTVVLWQPPLLKGGANPDEQVRRSVTAEAADLLADLVIERTRTLAFVRSRRGAELVAGATQDLLADVDPSLPSHVATYRGGYLPEERRELEARLRSGDLLGLATTNALELGIDVSGLDAVISIGFPGTRAALEQQFGRAGRSGREAGRPEALGVFIARDEPLDAFLVHHPEALLGAPLEQFVFDADNPYVLGPHLAAAAHELPLTEADAELFGPRTMDGIAALEQAGWLRRRTAGWFWTRRDRASDLADLRSSGGAPVQIVDTATGRLIGTVDAGSADATVHEGAVYLHQGESWVSDRYDADDGVAEVHAEAPPYWTQARSTTEISIVGTDEFQQWGAATVSVGTVDVTSQVVAFTRRDHPPRQISAGGAPTGRPLSEEPLNLPERTLRTKAVWWTLPPAVVAASVDPADIPGAAHAAEHAAIGMLPLLATCDRWDLGGVSTALHPDTGMVTVFVHDAFAGGAGFAERGYEIAASWLRITRDLIAECSCTTGCPSCIQSPKCGNGNEPLDKAGAVRLLDLVLRDT